MENKIEIKRELVKLKQLELDKLDRCLIKLKEASKELE